MKSRLPSTPMEALAISGGLRFAVNTVHFFADLFGFWKHPRVVAAADFEDMTLLDKMYWAYKSKKPVSLPEKQMKICSMSQPVNGPLPIPAGFIKQHSLTLSAVGDLIKLDGLENSTDILYEKVAPLIFDADISTANLESQLSTKEAGAYTFNEKETPPLYLTKPQYEALKGHKGKRYTLLHTACNHTFDMGREGFETTLSQLELDGIMDLGTNRTPEDRQKGRILEKNGIKIGFVSATFGLSGKPIPEGMEYAVNVVKFHREEKDISLLNEQVAYCKGKGCDLLIASLHWGYEYEFFPRAHQVQIAHELADKGVDLIISHHAHVIQPVECYKPAGKPGRNVVIAYSLGNLTSSFSAPHLVLSGILGVKIAKGTVEGEAGEKTFIEDVRLTPVVQTEDEKDGKSVVRLEIMKDYMMNRRKETGESQNRYFPEIERLSGVMGYYHVFE